MKHVATDVFVTFVFSQNIFRHTVLVETPPNFENMSIGCKKTVITHIKAQWQVSFKRKKNKKIKKKTQR